MGEYLPKREPTIVFEFRDKSWFVPKVYKLMKKYNFCLRRNSYRATNKSILVRKFTYWHTFTTKNLKFNIYKNSWTEKVTKDIMAQKN